MIKIDPQINYFINEKENNVILFLQNSSIIFTLNKSSYLIFNELTKKQPKDLNECLQLVNDLSITPNIFFSTIEHFIKLKFILSDLKKSDYSKFLDHKNDDLINTTIQENQLQDIMYEPNLIASALQDGDGGGGDFGIAVPPFHFGDGY